MRIRSVLAAAVLAVSLAAAGATTATAANHDEQDNRDSITCSPYSGGASTMDNKFVWGGAHCGDYYIG